ncbi:MAG: hypothetical protein R3E68_11440 [Burkholderiaceae bacterium]
MAADVAAAIVVESGASIRNLARQEAEALLLDEDAAWLLAHQNLTRELNVGHIPIKIMNYESGGHAALVGPHWAASAVVTLSGAMDWLEAELSAKDLVAVVVNRDALFVYASSAPQDVIEGGRKFLVEAHATAQKPLGPALLSYRDGALTPILRDEN